MYCVIVQHNINKYYDNGDVATVGDQPVPDVHPSILITGTMGVKRKLLKNRGPTDEVDAMSSSEAMQRNQRDLALPLDAGFMIPGAINQLQDNTELKAKSEGSAAVKELFEGNYEDRRKFGVVDIFDTLGFAVS